MSNKTFFYIVGCAIVLAAIIYFASHGKPQSANLPPASSTSLNVGSPTTTPVGNSTGTPLTLSVYNNSQYNYKVLYTSDFSLFTQAQIAAYNFGAMDGSACDRAANSCFVLDKTPYANTNFDSAAVSVKILPDVKTSTACEVFDPQEIASGHQTNLTNINGLNYITAIGAGAGAGNFYETHYNRTWYNTFCVEVNATIHSTDPGVYSPPRPEFNANDVWYKLQVLVDSFRFIK